MPRVRLPASGSLFVAAIIAAGVLVCAVAARDLSARPLSIEWLILVGLTAAAGWAALRVPAMPISFSISDTFAVIAAITVGPAAGALTAAVDGLVLSFRMANDRRTPSRVLFNIAVLAVSTWLAGRAYVALGGSDVLDESAWGAVRLTALAALFAALHFGLNSVLVAVAVALERRASIAATWHAHFRSLWVSSFGGAYAAMLLVALSHTGIAATLVLIAPLPVVLYVALRHALGRAEDRIDHLEKMNTVYVATIEALAQAVDAKDQVTHDHVRRVQDESLRLAGVLGVDDPLQRQAIEAASLLHDIGKIGIPEHILNKPGKLTPAEFEIMKRHPVIGADILSVIGFPYPLIPIVRHHHENWDGTGYPDGVRGEDIPIGARILQVVDCFDALTSDRPYRPAMTTGEALAIIRARRGTMYDPRVVDALLAQHDCRVDTECDAELQRHAAVEAPPVAAPDAGEVRLVLRAVLADAATPWAVGDALWRQLAERTPAAAFVLFVPDPHTDALRPAFSAGVPTVASDARIAVGHRLTGWVAANRRTIVNSDARLDLDADVRAGSPLRSVLSVPIEHDGGLTGVASLYAERAEAFDRAHQHLLEACAREAAGALSASPRSQAPVACVVS